MLDDAGKSIADTGIKRIAKNALEEGVEEVVSELANPLLRSMYKGGEALQDYGTGEYWAGVAKAGIVGSLTSLAYTGTVGYGLSKAGVGYVGKEADINESLAEIETQKKKAENLFANEKLTEQNESRISSNIAGNYQNIERTLKKASDTKRAKLIKQFSLEKAFNPDGSIKGEFATQIGLASNEAQVAQEGQQGANEGLASQFKKEYYSPSLRGSEAMIQSDLAAMTERLRTDEKTFAEQQGREVQEIAEVKPFTGEMSETARKNYTSLKKGLNSLNNTSGGKIRLVVVDPHDSINGSIVNDSTFYISESQLESGAWAETLVHEYTHFAEGSKEYGKLLGFLQSDDILVEGNGGQIPLWQKAQEAVIRNYGFDQKRLESIVDRVGKNETLSPEDMVYYNAYLSELGAHESEYLLGNEAFIDKIVRKDKSLAAKIIDKIRNLKSMFEKTNDTKTKKEQRLVNKAEKLWLNAVEKAGLKYSGGRIYRRREVDVEAQNEYNGEVAEVRLSRKDKLLYGIFPTYKESAGSEANTLATRWAHRADIQTGDRTAISYHDNWYLIEKFEDSDLGYQIVAQITAKQYQEFIEERNNGIGKGQSIQKGVSSLTSIDRRANSSNRGVVSDNPLSPRNGRGDNQVQRVGEEQSQRGKTQSNRSGDSESRRSSKQGIKHSLSDGEGFVHHDSAFYETEKGKTIASTMNMETCKQMIERVYYLINPNQYEESPIYKNAEHWLSVVGADEVALYLENEWIIQEKYLNKIPAVLEGDVYVAEIIEAYQDKALNGGNNKKAAKRLNVAEGVEANDSRFYAPQRVEEAKKLYEVANQKITNANRSEVNEARARILIFSHNKGAAVELGITQAELNKKLRSWSNYSANAREISQKINNGVAFANMWSGIENSSYLYNATITEEDFAPLVGKIEGRSSEYERRYIANTMLALDTHIDYTGINFVFGENFTERGVRGKYSDSDRTVRVRGGAGQQTVAHEIGHAIDHQWARDVWNWVDRKSTGTNNGLSEGLNLDLITIPEVRQWVENYFSFIDNISDSGNIHSEYLQSKNEVFARFVAQFVDWTVQIATGRSAIYSFSDFNDKFTMAQFVEFAKILQEKAKLDTKYRKPEASESSRKNIKFSRKEKDNIYHFINKFARIEISWNESNDTYHLYCENSKR